MKAYKGFNRDMTCLGFQYEEGGSYETDSADLCDRGFHACKYPLDCFPYYNPSYSEYHEVELDDVSEAISNDTKICAKKIIIGARVDIAGLVMASVEYIKKRIEKYYRTNAGVMAVTTSTDNRTEAMNSGPMSSAATTGHLSAAIAAGHRSACMSVGDMSAATSVGNVSAVVATGSRSAVMNTGDWSVAATAGDRSAVVNEGNMSACMSVGDLSAAMTTGYRSAVVANGHRSAAMSEGNRSVAATTGVCSAATAEGEESIAIAWGADSKAAASVGSYVVLAERNGRDMLIDAKMIMIDGDKYKAGQYYALKNGKIVEVD